jgi:hypothetical protein
MVEVAVFYAIAVYRDDVYMHSEIAPSSTTPRYG